MLIIVLFHFTAEYNYRELTSFLIHVISGLVKIISFQILVILTFKNDLCSMLSLSNHFPESAAGNVCGDPITDHATIYVSLFSFYIV